MFKSILRAMLGKLVIRRRFPAHLGAGTVYSSPAVALGWLKPNLETVDPLLFSITKKIVNEGDTVWDIGANVGLFSLLALPWIGGKGQVLAVEPDTWLCSLIERSVAACRESDAPITLIRAAVSDSPGTAKLNIAKPSRAANYLEGSPGSTQVSEVSHQEVVTVVTLDSLLEKNKVVTGEL